MAASLMGLPTELRQQILRHLLPTRQYIPTRKNSKKQRSAVKNMEAIAKHEKSMDEKYWNNPQATEMPMEYWKGTGIYIPLRHDFQSCHTAILRVNRILKAEGYSLLYTGVYFHATVGAGSLVVRDRLIFCHGKESEDESEGESEAQLEEALRPCPYIYLTMDEDIYSHHKAS